MEFKLVFAADTGINLITNIMIKEYEKDIRRPG